MSKNKQSAVYAGTFDPVTNGHLDIIERALKVFDHLFIAVAENIEKDVMFPLEQRIALLEAAVEERGLKDQVTVEGFSGMLIEHTKEKGVSAIVRGLRAVSDYEYEAQMALINRRLEPELETVFLVTSEKCSFISSSIVKNISRNGGDISGLVPRAVAEKLKS